MIPSDVLDRLRKIAGMMASSHEGERAAAVVKANEILQKYKTTWAEVIGTFAPAPEPRKPKSRPEPDWQDADGDINIGVIPETWMTNAQIRAYGAIFVGEDQNGDYDLGGTEFMESVLAQSSWSPKQRDGLVRSLRRAWVIRKQAGL